MNTRLITLIIVITALTMTFSCKKKPVEPVETATQVTGYDKEQGVYQLLDNSRIKLAGVRPLPEKALGFCPDLMDKLMDTIEGHLIRGDILQSNRVPCKIVTYGKANGVDLAEIEFPAWQAAKFRGKIDSASLKPVGQDRFLNFNKTLLFQGLALLDEETMPENDAADYRDAAKRAQDRKLGVWEDFCQQK